MSVRGPGRAALPVWSLCQSPKRFTLDGLHIDVRRTSLGLARPGERHKVAVRGQRGRPLHSWVRSQREQLGWSARRPEERAPGKRDGDHCRDDHQGADGDPRAPAVENPRRLLRPRGSNRRNRVDGQGGIRFEDRHVAALRQRDDDGIGSALVVLAQFVAEPPRVDPNHRIGTAVEVRPLPVELVGEDRFLERVSLPIHALFDDEREEAAKVLGSRKDLAGEDSLQLSADYVIRQVASRRGAGVGFGRHRALDANGRECTTARETHHQTGFWR